MTLCITLSVSHYFKILFLSIWFGVTYLIDETIDPSFYTNMEHRIEKSSVCMCYTIILYFNYLFIVKEVDTYSGYFEEGISYFNIVIGLFFLWMRIEFAKKSNCIISPVLVYIITVFYPSESVISSSTEDVIIRLIIYCFCYCLILFLLIEEKSEINYPTCLFCTTSWILSCKMWHLLFVLLIFVHVFFTVQYNPLKRNKDDNSLVMDDSEIENLNFENKDDDDLLIDINDTEEFTPVQHKTKKVQFARPSNILYQNKSRMILKSLPGKF